MSSDTESASAVEDQEVVDETESVVEGGTDAVGTTDVVDGGTDATTATSADAETVSADGQASGGDQESWRQRYERLGFQDLETPEQAQQRMFDAYERQNEELRRAQEEARYMRAIQSRLDAVSPSSQSHQPAQPEQPADATALGKFTNDWPEINHSVVSRYVVQDEDGNPQWKPDTPADIRAQVDQLHSRKAEWVESLSDPRFFQRAVSEQVEAIISERLSGELEQRDTMREDQMAETQFMSENDWIFQKDPVTGTIAVDYDGNKQLSSEGKRFANALQEAKSMGISRKRDLLNAAMRFYRASKADIQQAPATARQNVAGDIAARRQAVLGATNPAPAKPTTAAGITDVGSDNKQPRMSAAARAIHALKEEGMSF